MKPAAPSAPVIEPAKAPDVPAIAVLLREAGLPHEDFAPHLRHFLVARNAGGVVVGAIGAEVHGAEALLRSLVVAPAQRGAGLGGRLFNALEAAAGAWGVKRWWLLTTTAEAFFKARGFQPTPRSDVPPAIAATEEFRGLCPSVAACLSRERHAGRANGAGAGTFDANVTELGSKLRSFIRQRVRDDATADDLTQETFLKVYRSRAALRDGQRLEAWLYRIARTTLIDFYRRQRPGAELPADLTAESATGPDDVTAVMTRALREYLEELPATYREPVRLAEFDGLPLAQIARRLGLTLTAVKSRVQRGRAMLKKKLQQCCRLEFDRLGKVIGYERRTPRARCGC